LPGQNDIFLRAAHPRPWLPQVSGSPPSSWVTTQKDLAPMAPSSLRSWPFSQTSRGSARGWRWADL